MRLRDVVNQLHDKHSLSDTSTPEETNFASSLVGGQEVHDLGRKTCIFRTIDHHESCNKSHLDSGDQNFLISALLHEGRGLAMDRPGLGRVYSGGCMR